ncbi:sigma-54-dependent transcriptional regulator [Anatilimnocola floriformis]|uniref:sigma-54-dependent transcriptional regulator n=1 Tax=Anatilimnocola floriformis TaxID=2948575 RepID=UPI0020C3D821|nr:sigma-54 dependent transcriptional regulator [Anatilimnocola floriformis]
MKDEKNPDRISDAAEPAGPPLRVLIVDNDQALAYTMEESLTKVGHPCTVATSGQEGARKIETDNFDIIVTDLMMNDVDGMEILNRARQALPDAQVIMVTGHATISRAVEAMQHGAFNFLEKPITPNKLRAVVEKAVESVRLKQQNTELQGRLDEKFGFEGIIYASDKMKQVIDRLKRIAPTDASVLITGESGTGKEVIAQALHQNSPRKGKRIVALNCAAVAENLVESELFGHVKGAYTDAVADRQGAFEYANGGTLFLDEIGDMPLPTQIKLLRVLEDGLITRVGDNKTTKVNVRMVSATNRSLEDAIKAGTFRNDLYFRLKVVTIHLPPLRERREDIVPLTDHFRRQFARRHHKTIKSVSPAATKRLYAYDWPGNVRQLRNAIDAMVVLDQDGILDVDDLPPELMDESFTPAATANIAGGGPLELVGKTMDDIERWAIEQTLTLTSGNREEAARILDIGARTLYRKLEKYQSGDDGGKQELATEE